jgi:long-subunit acyl-CoA synthetase (AMP-forming)
LFAVEATKEVAVKAAEEAGWGPNGGGRVVLMSEGRDWSLKAIQKDGSLSQNLIDESQKLPWERITDPHTLENSLVVLIYSSGTTGLPKGIAYTILIGSFKLITCRR